MYEYIHALLLVGPLELVDSRSVQHNFRQQRSNEGLIVTKLHFEPLTA